MPNHFHLVVETPQPNLVAGMKWFLGSYTIRFNRRHRLTGHLFSGRYKAMVVDGSGNGYLRTVCDYVHLNPVRAKMLTTEQPLRDYRWASFRAYLNPPKRRPIWLRVDRLFGEMGIRQDCLAGRRQFERMVEERRQRNEPGEWRAIRRGWCLGEEQFRRELLERMSEPMGRGYYGGAERQETEETKAERILVEELKRRKWKREDLMARRKGDLEKVKMARRLRTETTMTWTWIAERLAMGAAGYAAYCLRELNSGRKYAIMRD